ncbi:MAG: HAD-IIIA family hydrolase [Chloroflexi bacterium]|nr:HAD-IIIA family hydrolase [Chloroflexota bacterium]
MQPDAALFLDRDGVINMHIRGDYVRSLEQFRFLPDAPEAIKRLLSCGWRIVVITNQAGIGKGLIKSTDLHAIHTHIRMATAVNGASITAFYFCPHRPEDMCTCRKPQPGLLLQAASDLGINLDQSVFIGDTIEDVLAGNRAGVKTILVRTGMGETHLSRRPTWPVEPDWILKDLAEAAELLC